jgi:cobyrinic acid a,c-diamide synthase
VVLESRFGGGRGGYAGPTLFASYLHQHLAATPEVTERFIAFTAGDRDPRLNARLG